MGRTRNARSECNQTRTPPGLGADGQVDIDEKPAGLPQERAKHSDVGGTLSVAERPKVRDGPDPAGETVGWGRPTGQTQDISPGQAEATPPPRTACGPMGCCTGICLDVVNPAGVVGRFVGRR
jgi:hypothetical protein